VPRHAGHRRATQATGTGGPRRGAGRAGPHTPTLGEEEKRERDVERRGERKGVGPPRQRTSAQRWQRHLGGSTDPAVVAVLGGGESVRERDNGGKALGRRGHQARVAVLGMAALTSGPHGRWRLGHAYAPAAWAGQGRGQAAAGPRAAPGHKERGAAFVFVFFSSYFLF
jgi:hypothetical protein